MVVVVSGHQGIYSSIKSIAEVNNLLRPLSSFRTLAGFLLSVGSSSRFLKKTHEPRGAGIRKTNGREFT